MKIDEICSKCGNNLDYSLTPNTIHYARVDCVFCKKWIRWVKNPNSPIRNKTSKFGIEKISRWHDFDKEFCWFCLRKKEQLGEHETLTIDHIQELDKDGKDELGNLQILCSACHKLKNWARLYMNWHLNGGESDTKTTSK